MRRVRGIGRGITDAVLGGLPTVRPINFELIAFANDLARIEASVSLVPSHPLFPFLLKRCAAKVGDGITLAAYFSNQTKVQPAAHLQAIERFATLKMRAPNWPALPSKIG